MAKQVKADSVNLDQQSRKIVTAKSIEVLSHLYKLESAIVVKQVGLANHPDEAPQDFMPMEHTHPYRTMDSDGKQHHRSASIGGHFHVITTAPDPKGAEYAPVIVSCSPPMKQERRRVKGKWTVVDVPLNDYDDHTHEITYYRSDTVKMRTTNPQAAQLMANEAQKGAPVPGVMAK